MSKFNTAFHNHVDYYIKSKLGTTKITDPVNWQNDFMEVIRGKDNAGVINRVSTNLEFIADGADLLTKIKDTFGTETEVRLEKWIMHPTLIKRIKSYDAMLDMSEYKYSKNKVTLKAQESDILSKINTYKGEDVELERTDSLNGNTLPLLSTETVAIPGKEILLVSELGLNEDYQEYVVTGFAGSILYQARAIPLRSISESDERISAVTNLEVPNNGGTYAPGTTGNMFYAYDTTPGADIEKTIKIKINIDFDYTTDGTTHNVILHLVKYSGNEAYNFSNATLLAFSSDGKLTYNDEVEVSGITNGDSFALVAFITSSDRMTLTYNTASVVITENSWHPASTAKVVLPYERVERLLQIITGRTDSDLFYSECLGRTDLGYAQDGEYAYLASSTGFWARGFDEKPFTTNWEDTIKTLFAVKGLAFGVENRGDAEVVVLEPIEYFYQKGEVFDFPTQVKDVERTIANDFQYSSIEVGYNKGGADYEEAMGLDEPNGKHTYTTPFSSGNKKYSIISQDRGDMTGFEFARRMPKEYFPTEDTRYDEDNFILELKKVDGALQQVLWEDLYAVEPSGIYSPQSAGNLGITPKRNLITHSWWLNGGLFKYGDQKIKFASSSGNSSLVTQKADDQPVTENGDVEIASLDTWRFQTEWVEFVHHIDQDLADLLNGYTVVNGRSIPNIYFEWRFINENGKFEKCRIFKVDPNKEGKFKVLKV